MTDVNLLIESAIVEKSSMHRIASVAVFCEGQVALVKAHKSDEWTLPGGRANEGETIMEAAVRELSEETGIKVSVEDLIFIGHITRSKRRVDTIFAVEIDKAKTLKHDDEIDEAKWTKVGDMPTLGFSQTKSVKEARRILKTPPEKRGVLIVFEGIDGSGKSTQVQHTQEWLEKHDYPFIATKWNSSPLLKKTIKAAKDRKELSPGLYFLLHAADMTHRYEQVILPALKRNLVVVCDRYWYTGMVRDGIRGIKKETAKDVYKSMRKPNLTFFCEVDPSVAVARLLKSGELSHYSAGMDMDLAPSKEESCLEYERMMAKEYPKFLPAGRVTLNMSNKIKPVFDAVKARLSTALDKHFIYDDNLAESAQSIVDILI